MDESLSEHIVIHVLRCLVESEHADWTLQFAVPDHIMKVHGTGKIEIDDAVVARNRDFDMGRRRNPSPPPSEE